MGDSVDLHQCLACSETIVGLEAYVAHRQAGCSAAAPAPAKPPLSSLPVIDVKRIVFVGGGSGGAGAVQGILTGTQCSPLQGGAKLATIRRGVTVPGTTKRIRAVRTVKRSSVGVGSVPRVPSGASGPLTLKIHPREASPANSPADFSVEFPDASPAASPPAFPPASPSVYPKTFPSASPSLSPASASIRTFAKPPARRIPRHCDECNLDFKSRTAFKEHVELSHRNDLQPTTSRAARKLGKRKAGLKVPAWVRSAQAAAAVAGLEPSMQSDDEFGTVEDILNQGVVDDNPRAKGTQRIAVKRAWSLAEGGGGGGDDGDGDYDNGEDDVGGGGDDGGGDGDGGGVDEGALDVGLDAGGDVEDGSAAPGRICPLCGPFREASLAAHMFSPDHAVAYRAFRPALEDAMASDTDSVAVRLRELTFEAMVSSAPFAPFRCHPCRFSCNLLSDLKRHLNATGHWLHRARKRCSLCRQLVTTTDHLDTPDHENGRVAFVTDGGYKCGECGVQFSLEFVARRHMVRRHGGDPRDISTCATCNAMLTKESVEEHNRIHEVPRRCETCGKQLNTAEEVDKHFRKSTCQYSGNIRHGKYGCRHCDFRNNLKVNVLFHESLSHHAPHTSRKKPTSGPGVPLGKPSPSVPSAKDPRLRYLCPLCDLYFRKASLKSHLMKHTGEAPFHCLFCSRYFFVESERDQHELTSHQRRQQQEAVPRPCEQNTLSGIQRATHPDVSCPICGRKFKNGHAVRMHVTREHRGESRPCPVEECDYTSTHASLLNRHLAVKHPNYRRFRCAECPFACNTAVTLDTHMNMHSGLKPYKCKHCEFATRFPPHLKRHMRIHTGARPFPCPYCEYRANNFENLRKHVITTRCHPGLAVYMCTFCPSDGGSQSQFGTNYAREFKQHLREQHADQFETGAALATYVAGLYNREDDVIETDSPIDHTYKERSKIPRPRRPPTARRSRQPAAVAATATAAGSLAVTVLPGKQFFRLSRGRGQQVLAPRGKLAIATDPTAAATSVEVLSEVHQEVSTGAPVPAIDYVDVGDSLSLQMAPPADSSLGAVTAEEPRRFAPPPLGAEAALQSELADDPGDTEPRPTRFSGEGVLIEPAVPQVHIEDQSVHRTTLIKTEADSPENEVISLETNFPTEITVVHSEETGECSSLLMTFFTEKGSRHVMVPRDVIIHKPEEPVFRRIKVVFSPDETEGADKVTIHKFY